MQGSMSQNLDLGPILHFMKCRILHFKKLPVFKHQIKTRALMKKNGDTRPSGGALRAYTENFRSITQILTEISMLNK